MKIDFRKLTRNFLLGEQRTRPTVRSYIQNLKEILDNFAPKTQTESRRLEIAKAQLREIKNLTRKLESRVVMLEEELKILEESK